MDEVEVDRDDDARRAIDGPGSIYQTQTFTRSIKECSETVYLSDNHDPFVTPLDLQTRQDQQHRT